MTPEDVKARVRMIAAVDKDDERAHVLEDSLWADVLQAISRGECTDPAECARLALTTAHIEFARWCA